MLMWPDAVKHAVVLRISKCLSVVLDFDCPPIQNTLLFHKLSSIFVGKWLLDDSVHGKMSGLVYPSHGFCCKIRYFFNKSHILLGSKVENKVLCECAHGNAGRSPVWEEKQNHIPGILSRMTTVQCNHSATKWLTSPLGNAPFAEGLKLVYMIG